MSLTLLFDRPSISAVAMIVGGSKIVLA